jgi:hypothetical protein
MTRTEYNIRSHAATPCLAPAVNDMDADQTIDFIERKTEKQQIDGFAAIIYFTNEIFKNILFANE